MKTRNVFFSIEKGDESLSVGAGRGIARQMQRYIKPFMALVFFLGIATVNCSAGTYTSKKNPQLSVDYEHAPGVYLTVGQCKNYSRQNPGKVVSCWATLSRHFYLNGEVVDDRMEEIAKTQMTENVFIFLLVLALVVFGFYIYMLPTFMAYNRQHPQRFYIMLLNFFLGNTLVGWIAALIWARGGGGTCQQCRPPQGQVK